MYPVRGKPVEKGKRTMGRMTALKEEKEQGLVATAGVVT
jgi:hypothetical protein